MVVRLMVMEVLLSYAVMWHCVINVAGSRYGHLIVIIVKSGVTFLDTCLICPAKEQTLISWLNKFRCA